jgi:hypothetical protein
MQPLDAVYKLKEALETRAKSYTKKDTLDVLKLIDRSDANFSQLQPFVFTSSKLPENETALGDVPKADPNTILACPFPLFSIELEDIALTATELDTRNGMGTQILTIICQELSANVFRFWSLNRISFTNGTEQLLALRVEADDTVYDEVKQISGKPSGVYQSLYDICAVYIDRLHREQTGYFNAKGRAKTKIGRKKGNFRPKQTIYVTPKVPRHLLKQRTAQNTQNITWLHTWSVMCHWRRLKNPESLGLNRLGERDEVGATWIDTYKKGEGQELPKVRRVN